MTSYDIGDMFWGKSQSYPWWPCVIMTNNNEIKRTRKKTGTQYHVQFIGPNYDACWITNNFLIKYNGKENFESYVEQQLRSSLPAQHKLIFEMKMTGQTQAMWIQACQDAEKIYQLNNIERTYRLPKLENCPPVNGKKQKMKKKISKASSKTQSKMSDSTSVSDTVSVDTKCIDIEESNSKDSMMTNEIDEICRRVYLSLETEHRMKNSAELVDHTELEHMLQEQWSVLDVETKLLYLDSDIVNMSKSRVSGRKIKVPSRLRRTAELENIKKATLKRRVSEPIVDKKKINCTDVSSNLSFVNSDEKSQQLSDVPVPSSLQINFINRETLDSNFLKSLTIQDSSMEIVKIIVDKQLPTLTNVCHQCFKSFKIGEKYKQCKGDCKAVFHFMCAINQKLFRSDDNNRCVSCVSRDQLCCICNNSKYMKRQSLDKCMKSDCSMSFHYTCLTYLNSIDPQPSNDSTDLICPNHSCLTCCRQDAKHPCNVMGSLVSCTKCPISYHNNLLCIPSGCRFMGSNKINCHRHFHNGIQVEDKLTRCFVCFNDNATLHCCRCRAVFHPKCMNMPTYTDLLKDYVCSTCKLEQPMFYGQIVWTDLGSNAWTPAEIISPSHVPMNILTHLQDKSMVIRTINKGEYRRVNSCELVSFVIGQSVLKGFTIVDQSVLDCARKMHIVYCNWRQRMRPYKPTEQFPILTQTELLNLSTNSMYTSRPFLSYETIKSNRYDNDVKNSMKNASDIVCSCAIDNIPCGGNSCYNFINKIECNKNNCKYASCENRKFADEFSIKPLVTDVEVIDGLGVKIFEELDKGAFIGECVGQVVSHTTAYNIINQHNNLHSNYFVFHLRDNWFVNCEKIGNEWRHLNHSCNPNAQLVCWNASGEMRLAIVLLKTICNEEITIDYVKSRLLLKYGFKCNCKANNCVKTVGPTLMFAKQTNIIVPNCCIDNGVVDESAIINTRPDSLMTMAAITNMFDPVPIPETTMSVTVSKTERSSLTENQTEMNVCHRCNCHGELVTCNKINCHKKYHLQCVQMSSAPNGLWYCPKHFCIECGQAATIFCSNCSTSSCRSHNKLQKQHNCEVFALALSSQNVTPEKPTMIKEANSNVNVALEEPILSQSIIVTPSTINHKFTCSTNEIDTKLDVTTKSEVCTITKETLFKRSELKRMSSNALASDHTNSSLVINKHDLYSSCDLEPIKRTNECDLSINSNSNSPSQINLTIKRASEIRQNEASVKKSRLSRNVCNISNYMSTDEDIDPIDCVSEEDVSDLWRCQVIPMGIVDMENLIISPVILDD